MVRRLFSLIFLGWACARMPLPMCGWPELKENSVSPPQTVNTQTIQYLLNATPDGIFGPRTTTAVKAFQEKSGLTADGVVGEGTWTLLLPNISSAFFSAEGVNATAVQFNLYYNSSTVPYTSWSSTLTDAITEFQNTRHLPATGEMDSATWHLLVTDCDRPTSATPGSGAYGFDAGWPEGLAKLESLECLRNAGLEFAIFEAFTESHGFWEDAVSNVANAWKAKFSFVDVYHFPKREYDPVEQANEMLGNLTQFEVKYGRIWIDIEGGGWLNHSHSDNVIFLQQLAHTFVQAGKKIGIYCGREFPQFFGSWTGLAEYPVWYAHYDRIPSFRDWFGQPYGGWASPTIKQFFDHKDGPVADCGLEIDWDYAEQFPVD